MRGVFGSGVIATALVLAAASASSATIVATDICAVDADPCIYPQGTTIVVAGDSVLDFGARDFIMPPRSGTQLQVAPGVHLVIRAGSVTMNAGSAIIGPSAHVTLDVVGNVVVARDGNSRARIDVADAIGPGTIAILSASGDLIVDGFVDARGTSTDAGFGSIEILVGGDALIAGELRASGRGFAGGGDVIIATGGDLNVSGIVDVSGSDGGVIDVAAEGRILTSGSPPNRLDARATSGGGSGGEVSLIAGSNVVLGSTVHVQGENSQDFGGDGGFFTIDAGRTVTLAGAINVFGTFPDGAGGDTDISAGLDIVQTGPLNAVGKPGFGLGGTVTMLARRNLALGVIDVRGDCAACDGGAIAVQGWCAVSVPPTAVLTATGAGGIVTIEAGSSLTVGGTITAGDIVELFLSPDAEEPTLAGATITPAPLVLTDPGVVPCGGLPSQNCGNGVLDEGEECDDGNRLNCDGCSSICQIEAPGNGRIDCGEVCDDGNTVSCDGCAADLSREDDICGDGILECGEQCDDGNTDACDGCSASCRIERCGNGIPECDEDCDLGDALNGDPNASCDAQCRLQAPVTCGDGVVDAPFETCDDGGGDCDGVDEHGVGCSSLCQEERCGNGIVECDEECDDFNLDPCDGCSPTCVIERCGNGIVECGEECDDGELNGQPGSNCLAELCQIGAVCSSDSTSPCIPCGSDFDCDPSGRCGGVECREGICELSPLDCDDQNPCTADACDPDVGCTHTLRDASQVPSCTASDRCTVATCTVDTGCVVTALDGFDGVRCHLADLDARLADGAVHPRAARVLGKLGRKIQAKVTLAETGVAAGKPKRVSKGLTKSDRLLGKLRRRVERFTGVRLPLALAAELIDTIDDAAHGVRTLRTDLLV